MFTVQEVKSHLTGLGHGGTLNKVRFIDELFERSASKFLARCKPLETIRTGVLASTIHDDLNDYALPSDYNTLIDLIPQDNRGGWDTAYRTLAGQFDLHKAVRNKVVSIEGSEGTKVVRINWRTRQGKTIHTMNSLTDNGTWGAVASASGLVANTIFKVSGSASIEFDIIVSGD